MLPHGSLPNEPDRASSLATGSPDQPDGTLVGEERPDGPGCAPWPAVGAKKTERTWPRFFADAAGNDQTNPAALRGRR
jgi:hypothetical protein